MCSPHVSFLSNVIPKNVIWSLNSISLPNKVSFCNDPMFIFLLENIMALVFKVEILKPQSWDHISISSRADWILLSASLGDECLVQIALSFANWESDRFGTSPRASSKVFIMTLHTFQVSRFERDAHEFERLSRPHDRILKNTHNSRISRIITIFVFTGLIIPKPRDQYWETDWFVK